MNSSRSSVRSGCIIRSASALKRPVLRLASSLIWLMLLGSSVQAEVSTFEVIRVYHRPAGEIQALLGPMLSEDDQVMADGANLVLKTTAANLPTLRALVKKLDAPLQDLLITVLQTEQVGLDELNAGAGAEAPPSAGGGASAPAFYSYRTKKQSGGDHHYTVRVRDGSPAIIERRQIYPVPTYQNYSYGGGYYGISQSSERAEAGSGFSVTPRLLGRQVLLDVAPWLEDGARTGQTASQDAHTTFKTDLGRWVELGSLQTDGHSGTDRSKGRIWQTNAEKRHIYIKVDKTP